MCQFIIGTCEHFKYDIQFSLEETFDWWMPLCVMITMIRTQVYMDWVCSQLLCLPMMMMKFSWRLGCDDDNEGDCDERMLW